MRNSSRWSALGILLAALWGCAAGSAQSGGANAQPNPSPPPSTPVRASCMLPSTHACEEYHGNVADAALQRRQTSCTAERGQWSTGPCPPGSIVLGCEVQAPEETGNAPGSSMVTWQYFDNGVACDLPGLRAGCEREHGRYRASPRGEAAACNP